VRANGGQDYKQIQKNELKCSLNVEGKIIVFSVLLSKYTIYCIAFVAKASQNELI